VLCNERLADFGRCVFYVQWLKYSGDLVVFGRQLVKQIICNFNQMGLVGFQAKGIQEGDEAIENDFLGMFDAI
jgi:hypothetical protein